MKRSCVPQHQQVCPELVIPCTFANVGCKVFFKRKDQTDHDQDNLAEHVAMLNIGMKQLGFMRQQVKDLTGVVENLVSEVKALAIDDGRQMSTSAPYSITEPEQMQPESSFTGDGYSQSETMRGSKGESYELSRSLNVGLNQEDQGILLDKDIAKEKKRIQDELDDLNNKNATYEDDEDGSESVEDKNKNCNQNQSNKKQSDAEDGDVEMEENNQPEKPKPKQKKIDYVVID